MPIEDAKERRTRLDIYLYILGSFLSSLLVSLLSSHQKEQEKIPFGFEIYVEKSCWWTSPRHSQQPHWHQSTPPWKPNRFQKMGFFGQQCVIDIHVLVANLRHETWVNLRRCHWCFPLLRFLVWLSHCMVPLLQPLQMQGHFKETSAQIDWNKRWSSYKNVAESNLSVQKEHMEIMSFFCQWDQNLLGSWQIRLGPLTSFSQLIHGCATNDINCHESNSFIRMQDTRKDSLWFLQMCVSADVFLVVTTSIFCSRP